MGCHCNVSHGLTHKMSCSLMYYTFVHYRVSKLNKWNQVFISKIQEIQIYPNLHFSFENVKLSVNEWAIKTIFNFGNIVKIWKDFQLGWWENRIDLQSIFGCQTWLKLIRKHT